MQRRVVVLGTGPIVVDETVPREADSSLEQLLASEPDAAIIAARDEACFFRASLAFERGVRRVVIRPGSMDESWVDELASRAAELGSELFIRGDDGRYVRARSQERHEVGAPPVERFAAAAVDVPSAEPMPAVELSDAERAVACEEVGFAIGLKPVLYLVAPASRVDEVLARYPGADVARSADRCESALHSGERTYGRGVDVVHLFIGRGAARAAELWADGGSSRHVEELGALMGYPRCCVRAFRAMANRRVNAAFPYVTAARTRALGGHFEPLLDVTGTRLVPFVPCSYSCVVATLWARRIAAAASVERRARVVLYFDEARAIAFDEAVVEPTRLCYRGPRWAAPHNGERSMELRRACGAVLGTEGTLAIDERGRIPLETAGGLGVVLPFA